jgi:hypothetical protein
VGGTGYLEGGVWKRVALQNQTTTMTQSAERRVSAIFELKMHQKEVLLLGPLSKQFPHFYVY